MANVKTEFEQIRDRLDLIAHLLCLQIDPSKVPAIGDQIAILATHGLTGAEIGRIVGKEANYVSAVIGQQKKKEKKGAK